ncbi:MULTISPECIES: YheC/YheD family protein [Brevibacillus]|uniref:YheC/YheD family protein n=1 Tax=Brevibacillus invocatus TaxID=173959 RepID=A0A3M8C1Z5_9BACL|nr:MULTISPECIES: YheC/YheD family protein [Brevibacillus]MCM3079433.1 YheC/YheD family protein [Brevibacillus invocatus]MCM3429515.1 YheC/YheD family protein [Brevibacillus invocatus]MDH4618231.1 YheC/YheD family protein [Brevibacillus sp. AY1]RNB69503.1 YheC/YheD family protein [Brevibacillus invocatus]
MPANRSLGIMTRCQGSHFVDKGYYRKLTLFGRKQGIRVFVFSPRKVDYATRTVKGFEYRNGAWQSGTFPLPALVYDRCFIGPSYRHYKPFVEKLQNDPAISFLGYGLSGKWQVQQMLSKSRELAPYLPPTQLYTLAHLEQTLDQYGAAIIKPTAGTHGIGVVRIKVVDNGFEISGRGRENQPFRRVIKGRPKLKLFLSTFTAGRKFLVQPYLELHTADGTPFDVRVLVQKNGRGEWETTGKAVRLGDPRSITSNLHGGGKAVPLEAFLARHFKPSLKVRIEQQVNRLASELPAFLEQSHGRLVELGIDVGIDRAGNVWVIEVNSRPGRTVFQMINDPVAKHHSMTQPVRYANYLMKERVGGY